jgi:hypothetical protein
VLWLVLLARERDPYFDPDHVTRWEFVERGGNQWYVVAAIVAAAATAIGLVIAIVTRRRWIRQVAAVAATVTFVLVLAAEFALSVGH